MSEEGRKMHDDYERRKVMSEACCIRLREEMSKRGVKHYDYADFIVDGNVCLDGYFDLTELLALVAVMQAREDGSITLASTDPVP